MTQKIAFVTGSSRGIGKGIAIQLAKAGYDLGIHYSTTPDGAMDTKAQIEAMGRKACVYRADIRQLDQIQAMFQAFFQDFDHIDLMVNNAGVTRMKPFLEIGPDMFEEVINTDLRGSFFCAQAAARNMVDKQVHGVIINIASNHAIGCWPGSTVYAAAKAGLEKMGKNMAMELSKYGIRVATVAPGYTLLPENVEELVRVARSTTVPIATGERLFTRYGFREVLEKQAASVLQPDTCHAGGISELVKIGAMAETYYGMIAPHNPLGPISLAACLQVDAACPNFLIQEHPSLENGWDRGEGYLKEAFEIKAGYIDLPTKPGLGIEVDEEVIRERSYPGDWDTPRAFHEDGSVALW